MVGGAGPLCACLGDSCVVSRHGDHINATHAVCAASCRSSVLRENHAPGLELSQYARSLSLLLFVAWPLH
eukprot:11093360-Prorocentrum_lima.AAC.1